jgi:hypothetical protein
MKTPILAVFGHFFAKKASKRRQNASFFAVPTRLQHHNAQRPFPSGTAFAME